MISTFMLHIIFLEGHFDELKRKLDDIDKIEENTDLNETEQHLSGTYNVINHHCIIIL